MFYSAALLFSVFYYTVISNSRCNVPQWEMHCNPKKYFIIPYNVIVIDIPLILLYKTKGKTF